MLIATKITLTAVLALCLAVTATAAATKHRAAHASPGTYRAGGGEAIITNQCLPTDDPCRTKPDGW
jgi:hypothetical protein